MPKLVPKFDRGEIVRIKKWDREVYDKRAIVVELPVPGEHVKYKVQLTTPPAYGDRVITVDESEIEPWKEREKDPSALWQNNDALWRNNEVQFARLIDEIMATGVLTEAVWNDLLVSMNLDTDDLSELFTRAERAWMKTKASHNA